MYDENEEAFHKLTAYILSLIIILPFMAFPLNLWMREQSSFFSQDTTGLCTGYVLASVVSFSVFWFVIRIVSAVFTAVSSLWR